MRIEIIAVGVETSLRSACLNELEEIAPICDLCARERVCDLPAAPAGEERDPNRRGGRSAAKPLNERGERERTYEGVDSSAESSIGREAQISPEKHRREVNTFFSKTTHDLTSACTSRDLNAERCPLNEDRARELVGEHPSRDEHTEQRERGEEREPSPTNGLSLAFQVYPDGRS